MEWNTEIEALKVEYIKENNYENGDFYLSHYFSEFLINCIKDFETLENENYFEFDEIEIEKEIKQKNSIIEKIQSAVEIEDKEAYFHPSKTILRIDEFGIFLNYIYNLTFEELKKFENGFRINDSNKVIKLKAD